MAGTTEDPRPESPVSAPEAPARATDTLKAANWLQGRLETIHHWMESTGLGTHAIQFLLIWWRKLGTSGMAALMLAVVLPAGGYASLSYSTSHSIPGWIGDFGVVFEAEDWDIHVFSLKSVARNVKLRRDAKSDPVLTAAEIEFNGSLWSVISSIWGGGRYNEITIRHGEVIVERSLTGDYNWADFLRGVPEERREAAVNGAYTVKALYLENMRVIYLEHVPGGSGGGVVRTAQARVIFEAVNANLLNLRAPVEPNQRPTQFSVKGRLADGIIEIKGDAGILQKQLTASRVAVRSASMTSFGSAPAAPPGANSGNPYDQPAGATVQTISGGSADGPSYVMRIYLENLAMGAYGTMAASTTQIVPSRGSLGGNVNIEQAGATFSCTSELVMDDVAFAPNPKVAVTKVKYDELSRTLQGYRNSGPFDVCGGGDAKVTNASLATRGTASAMLATFNAQATETAPSSIRAITLNDQNRLAGVVANVALEQFLRESAGDTGVTRGLKSVGRGIKKLFGGGK